MFIRRIFQKISLTLYQQKKNNKHKTIDTKKPALRLAFFKQFKK